MSISGNVTTNYSITGTDIGVQYPLNNAVQKDYLIDVYPSLISTFKQSGLWLVGYNAFAQLGTNDIADRLSPVQTISGGTNWKQISNGVSHTAAIKTDGTLWAWGDNGNGQLGDNSIIRKSSPVQTVSSGTNWVQLTTGYYHTAAIKTDGTLWTWGQGIYGTIGDNSIIRKSSPVQTVSGGTNWKLVSGSGYHVAAIKTDATLWLWGRNSHGQIGDNGIAHRSSPVQTVAGGTDWKLVSGSRYHTAAIKTNGTLWTWGLNTNGQLGDNSIIRKSSPVQTIAGGTNWRLVACGDIHTAAIKTDGTLWTWGHNYSGQLGTNTTTHRSSPVQTVAGGTNWKLVACGSQTASIKTDGTLWTWGNNYRGQLGDGTSGSFSHKSSPVQTVAAGTNWKLVACGDTHTTFIRDDSADIFGDPI